MKVVLLYGSKDATVSNAKSAIEIESLSMIYDDSEHGELHLRFYNTNCAYNANVKLKNAGIECRWHNEHSILIVVLNATIHSVVDNWV